MGAKGVFRAIIHSVFVWPSFRTYYQLIKVAKYKKKENEIKEKVVIFED